MSSNHQHEIPSFDLTFIDNSGIEPKEVETGIVVDLLVDFDYTAGKTYPQYNKDGELSDPDEQEEVKINSITYRPAIEWTEKAFDWITEVELHSSALEKITEEVL